MVGIYEASRKLQRLNLDNDAGYRAEYRDQYGNEVYIIRPVAYTDSVRQRTVIFFKDKNGATVFKKAYFNLIGRDDEERAIQRHIGRIIN